MRLKAYFLPGFLAKAGFTISLFLANLLMARVMGADESGSFFYTINNLSIIVLVASLSMESGLSYHLSKKNISERDAASLSVVWGTAASLLPAAVVLLIPGIFSEILVNKFWFALLFIFGNLLIGFFSALFYAKKEFAWPLLVPLFTNLIVIFFCCNILLGKASVDINLLAWIYFSSYLLAGIIITILFFSKYALEFSSFRSLKNTTSTIIGYSLAAFSGNLIAFLMYRIDYWIIEFYIPVHASHAALGNYIQVAKLVQLFLFTPTLLATIIFPLTASGNEVGAATGITKILIRVSFMNMVLIVVMVCAGRWLFTFMYGKDFNLMYNCSLYLIPGILAISGVSVLGSYLAGLNKVRYNITGGGIALFLICTLNFLLIPAMGINGAALADSVGYAAYFLFLYWHFIKSNRV